MCSSEIWEQARYIQYENLQNIEDFRMQYKIGRQMNCDKKFLLMIDLI